MATERLENTRWQSYFNHLSKIIEDRPVEIAVASLDTGAQVAADWMSLMGVTYDPHDDAISVATEFLDDIIDHPREVYVDYDAGGVRSIDIVDEEGKHQVITLKSPLSLTAAPGV